MTPIQQAIAFMDENWSESEIDSDDWLRLIYSRLQSLLPKEREFAEKCFDGGIDFSEGTEQPNKQQYIDSLYKTH